MLARIGIKKPIMGEVKEELLEQRIIDIARVTRVQAGGKRMRFRACVALGDLKGKVGLGVKKGADVTMAVNKAVNSAKKNLYSVKIVDGTVPHAVSEKYCGARVLLRPALKGRGVIAGGPIRAILELAGIKNVVSKMLGSKNKISNARATIEALKKTRTKEEIYKLREK